MQQHINLEKFLLYTGKTVDISLSYHLFGQPLGKAPIILVNHALTGNAEVTGENGWWKSLIGYGKAIDLDSFTILAFNIPGNGQGNNYIKKYHDFKIKDIAKIFLEGLDALNITQLYAVIGGSLGGAIAWEMAFQKPNLAKYIFPIATDFQSSDWLIGQCHVQENILLHSAQPIQDARKHAMFLYRTPESLNRRFQNQKTSEDLYQIQDWLNYHGKALEKRFSLNAYLLMNHLLKTIWVTDTAEDLSLIQSEIHIVSVDSDGYFTHKRATETYKRLKKVKSNTFLHTIHSIHGHDAFLMEYEQLSHIIKKVLSPILEEKSQLQNQL